MGSEAAALPCAPGGGTFRKGADTASIDDGSETAFAAVSRHAFTCHAAFLHSANLTSGCRGTTPDRGPPERTPNAVLVVLRVRSLGRQASGSSSMRNPRIGEGACGMTGFGCGGTPGRIGAIVWVIWLIAEPAMAGAGPGMPGFGAAAA
jgi:hypothetical protein